MKWHAAPAGAQNAVLGRESLELAVMVRPDVGRPAPPQEIWEKVVRDDARLPGAWEVSVRGALEAAHQGDWAVCTYLAARCFQDAGGDEAGAQALAAPDEAARDRLWLTAVEPLVIEVPKGLERMYVLIDDKEEPEWIPTDRLKLSPDSQDRVELSGGRAGVLAAGAYRSSEHFNVGETVEVSHLEKVLSRPRSGASPSPKALGRSRPGRQGSAPRSRAATELRRLRCSRTELLELRALLPGAAGEPPPEDELAGASGPCAEEAAEVARAASDCPQGPTSRRSQSATSSARVPGGLFHVLSYPLGGDFTKVLLRPAKRAVPEGAALRALAESLVSHCAKAGQWDLVETLLRAGVPCPDLEEEFSGLCGGWPSVRRRWGRDLAAAVGPRLSLLGLATAAPGDKPLRCMLAALRGQGRPLAEEGRGGRAPQLLALAEASRWDLVALLLEEVGSSDGPGVESIVPLAESPVMARAPPEVLELVHGRVLNEKLAGVRAKSLREYFERQLKGEVMGEALMPAGYTLGDGVLSAMDNALQVLDRAVRLRDAVAADDAEVAFISVSSDELTAAVEATADPDFAMLPVDLGGKVASPRDPAEPGAWVAVLCPAGYLGKSAAGGLALRIPAGRFPTPYVPRTTVSVVAVTPCCGTPVEGVLLHVGGRRAGTTDASGTLRLMLPAGRHTITAPGQARRGKTVEVKQASCSDETPVQFTMSGELFLYLQDMSLDDEAETRMGVMLTASRDQIPSDAQPFNGAASMLQRSLPSKSRRSEFNPAVKLQESVSCDGSLYRLQAHLAMYTPSENLAARKALVNFASSNRDGLLSSCFFGWTTYAKKQAMGQRLAHSKIKYFPNLDAPVWVGCRHSGNECATALLFGSPLRLGNLIAGAASQRSSPKNCAHRGCAGGDLEASMRCLSRSLSESLRSVPPPGPRRGATGRPCSAGATRSRPPSAGRGAPRPPRPPTARRPPRPRGSSARPPGAAHGGGGGARACGDQRARHMFFDPYEVDFVYAS